MKSMVSITKATVPSDLRSGSLFALLAAAKQAAHNNNLELFAFALERGAPGSLNYNLHTLVAYKQKWACLPHALKHGTACSAKMALLHSPCRC
jgi:hypothetical protein